MDNENFPDDLITLIMSKLDDARDLAAASMVCKTWLECSNFISDIRARCSELDDDTRLFRMIHARRAYLTEIDLLYEGFDRVELCLGAAVGCDRLTGLTLKLVFSVTPEVLLVRIFQILAVSRTLERLTLYIDFSHHIGHLDGVRFVALKKLAITGNIEVSFKDFLLAFPALEELHYVPAMPLLILEIVSNTLTMLVVRAILANLIVQAPQLSNLYIYGVRSLSCQSSPKIAHMECVGSRDITCDRISHVTSLLLHYGENSLYNSIDFPRLERLQTLHYKGNLSHLDNFNAAVLSRLERASLYIHGGHISELRHFLRKIHRIRYLCLWTPSLEVKPETDVYRLEPVSFPYLRKLELTPNMVLHPLLTILIDKSDALEVLNISTEEIKDEDELCLQVQRWTKWIEIYRQSVTVKVSSQRITHKSGTYNDIKTLADGF